MISQQTLAPRERWASHSRRERSRRAERSVFGRPTERKLATVLFVDVQGSMDLSAAIEPEEWWSLLDELFELMCEGVCRFGGWVANFTGDGINGVFEVRPAADEHALRACQAAMWLRRALKGPTAALLRRRGLELAVRIGINSGEILTGTIGDRYSRCYIASGYAVALAKRIEALASPGRVYLTEHTAALVADALKLQDLGPCCVKGAPAPVGVFELVDTPQ
jgi:class 3 adenylate cyclase